ncbi:MAG: sigma-70 family RNA polymerase sigma factor [Verrucomicrobia subdivision 3 bacterium]|nr:sigma-70 family RNA polymerase sigma factor [Limisphaerales bacterium]
MNECDDDELLQRYAQHQDADAFSVLVQRYLGLVYSAAFRRVGDHHLAEEIAQAVFVVLARKAGKLRPTTVLAAWLYQATRFAASDALKLEHRRLKYEQEAARMGPPDSSSAWEELAPVVDEAIDSLSETDRRAVLLRFFENKGLKEVGQALGVNEDSAQKRVARAVGKLRAFLAKREVFVPAVALTTILASQSVKAVPAGLSHSLLSGEGMKASAMSALVSVLVEGTLSKLGWMRLKPLLLSLGAVLFLSGTVVSVGHWMAVTGSPANSLYSAEATITPLPERNIFEAVVRVAKVQKKGGKENESVISTHRLVGVLGQSASSALSAGDAGAGSVLVEVFCPTNRFDELAACNVAVERAGTRFPVTRLQLTVSKGP